MTQTASRPASDKGWIDQIEAKQNGQTHELWELPLTLTDPFSSDAQRLDATLDTYRFSTEPRALIDWAVAQTQLDDPLSKYTRHELEHAFARFARDRDQHLAQLTRTLKHQRQIDVLNRAKTATPHAEARKALDRAMRR